MLLTSSSSTTTTEDIPDLLNVTLDGTLGCPVPVIITDFLCYVIPVPIEVGRIVDGSASSTITLLLICNDARDAVRYYSM